MLEQEIPLPDLINRAHNWAADKILRMVDHGLILGIHIHIFSPEKMRFMVIGAGMSSPGFYERKQPKELYAAEDGMIA